MRPQQLSEDEIQQRLSSLATWTLKDNTLYREFKFGNFIRAFAFMAAAALEAEKMNHHPDWRNVYNTIFVHLNTHDAGGITELDFELAEKLDKLHSHGI